MNTQELLEQLRHETESLWQQRIAEENILKPGERVSISIAVKVVEEPVVEVKVNLSPELRGENFGRKNCLYFTRQLTTEESEKLRAFPMEGWPQKITMWLLDNDNAPVTRDQLEKFAKESGFTRSLYAPSICSALNTYLKQVELPFRIHALPGERRSRATSSFRFYRKVQDS